MQETLYGTAIYPVTSQRLSALQGSYSFLLIIIVLFYAGELVWKERGAKINEVTDAMPMPCRCRTGYRCWRSSSPWSR